MIKISFKYEVLGQVKFGSELEDILKLKGIMDINSFLNPTVKNTESELLFDNIEKARDVFVFHINRKSKIDIVVDCDLDGYTSAAIIYQEIKEISPDTEIKYLIHKGKQHGLKEFVDEICFDDSSLVIVPDAGTGDSDECAKIIDSGKDIIILDHHEIDPEYNAAIVVNNQLSSKITDKAMTGVGVVYKFICVLDSYYKTKHANSYLDLVAVGMIADRADMTNLQSRYYILEGLKQIGSWAGRNKLIRVLTEAQMYSMNNKITVNGIGYYVCPLVNSLIRLGEYEDKCYLFEAIINSDMKLERQVRGKGIVEMSIQEYILKSCESSNRKQKKLTQESADVLSEEIEKYHLNQYPILVCNARDHVDLNSTGLIANRLADQYQRPCLLMRVKGNTCKGSARGYDKCEIQDFNKWCRDTGLFTLVEGHKEAFGVQIPLENTNKLYQLLSTMSKIDEPTYYVYNVYDISILHDQIIKNVAKYDYIWGNSVDEPIFLIKNVPCNKYNLNLIGAKQNTIEFTYHNIKFRKQTKGSSLAKLYKDIISTGDSIKFDIIGRFSIDVKNGKAPLVMIEDWMYEKSDTIQGFGV